MKPPKTSRSRLTVVLAATACALGAAAPVADAAPKLKLGVYDCMRYDYGSGFLMFSSTIKLKPGKRYEHAFGRKKAKLTDKSTGTYRIRGKRVKFKRGGMSKAPAEIDSDGSGPPHLNLLVEGRPSGISCYHVKKP